MKPGNDSKPDPLLPQPHSRCYDWTPRLSAQARLYHDPLLDRWVIAGPNQAILLDPASHEVLSLCDGQRSVRAICQLLQQQEITASGNDCSSVLYTITHFSRKGLLHDAAE